MDPREPQIDDWVYNIRNRQLFKAAVNLSAVRAACQQLMQRDAAGATEAAVGYYEMNLVNDALGALHNVAGSWDGFPFPTQSPNDLREFKPHPSTVYTYTTIILGFIERNRASLDK